MLPVTLKPCSPTSIVKFWGDALRASESTTIKVIGNGPVLVGVPDRVPSFARFRPGGSAPVSLQVSGASPPLAVNRKLYGRLIAPSEGGGLVLITGGGGSLMIIV